MNSTRALTIVCAGAALLGLSGCATDVEKIKRDYLERGDRYMQDHNVEAAIIEYRNALQRDSRFGEGYRKLAAAYLMQGNGVEAVRAGLTAAELQPDSVDAQLEAGSLMLLAGRFGDAKVLAEKVLAKNQQDVRGRVLLGNALAGLKDVDTAIKEFEEAIRLDPQQAGIYTGLASLKATAGDTEAAERIFKQAIATDPRSAHARLGLANFYWFADRLTEAEREMKEAHALAPSDVRVNVTLAMFYQAVKRSAEAEPYLLAAAASDNDPRLTIMLADYYAARNRGAEAARLLTPLAKDRRVGVLGSMRLAGIAQAAGRSSEALEIIDGALTADPKNWRTLAAKSDLLLQQQKVDDAVSVAEAAVAANPTSAEAQFVHGRALRAKGSFAKAEAAFNEVLRINPRAAAARIELARLHVRQGAADAVVLATEATKADPDSLDARLMLARAQQQKRNYAEAEATLRQLVTAAPAVAAVQAQLGSVLALKKDTPGARAAFQRALELNPIQLEALAGLTTLDFRAGKRQDALARLDAALARAPKNSGLLLAAAGAHLATNDTARAETLLLTAIETDPGAIGAYALLGRIYLSQKRIEEARHQFETLAARQERPVGALTLLGTLDMMQNRHEQAQQNFLRALQIDSRAGVAANNLAWMYLEGNGSVEQAVQLAETAKNSLPDTSEVSDTLGWAYYKQGRLPEAVAALRRSVELDPRSPTAVYHLALAHEKSGDRRRAAEALNLYLTLDPRSERGAEVRRRLEALGS